MGSQDTCDEETIRDHPTKRTTPHVGTVRRRNATQDTHPLETRRHQTLRREDEIVRGSTRTHQIRRLPFRWTLLLQSNGTCHRRTFGRGVLIRRMMGGDLRTIHTIDPFVPCIRGRTDRSHPCARVTYRAHLCDSCGMVLHVLSLVSCSCRTRDWLRCGWFHVFHFSVPWEGSCVGVVWYGSFASCRTTLPLMWEKIGHRWYFLGLPLVFLRLLGWVGENMLDGTF